MWLISLMFTCVGLLMPYIWEDREHYGNNQMPTRTPLLWFIMIKQTGVFHTVLPHCKQHTCYSTGSGTEEYCQNEHFKADCPNDHVILMMSASYGRMHLSRCVDRDYGYIRYIIYFGLTEAMATSGILFTLGWQRLWLHQVYHLLWVDRGYGYIRYIIYFGLTEAMATSGISFTLGWQRLWLHQGYHLLWGRQREAYLRCGFLKNIA